MSRNICTEPAFYHEDPPSHGANRSSAIAEAMLEFGRFRVLLRQRKLVADGLPLELGTRALDLLVVLLEADGSVVSKDELLRRVWPSVFVTQDNLKFQISALRKGLGKEIATLYAPRSVAAIGLRPQFARPSPRVLANARRDGSTGRRKRCFPRWTSRRPSHGWCVPRSR
jgi:Transcriptional regulatory protein, C terminal